ncbi:MAG: peptidase M29 [Chloroflexi bacterium RBG_16_48_8]|nr:MAG: peptidase M29 [Chloroflexi bacterium RBG_16_48_8]
MTDPCIVSLARILVEYSMNVQPGDRVGIIGSPLAESLIKEVFRYTLRAGGHPYPFMGIELLRGMDGLDEILFKEGNDEQIQHVPRTDEMILTEFEAMVSIRSEGNTHSLSNVDPSRQILRRKARNAIIETYFNRSAANEFNWCGTLFPTTAYAQDAEMSLSEFEDYVYSTTYADTSDPIAKWREIHGMQQKWVDWLVGKKHVQVKGPNVDLQLSIQGRTFINSDGKNNMPSGEIFTGPVEDSVNGWVHFTYPAVYEGREVENVRLEFEDGRVIKATAGKNEAFLLETLNIDPGARYLGEWAIGTNKMINRFIKNILFDEKIGGTFHLALGRGYPQTGSENKSAIHWDLICDMRDGGEIIVDGELFYRSGDFLI